MDIRLFGYIEKVTDTTHDTCSISIQLADSLTYPSLEHEGEIGGHEHEGLAAVRIGEATNARIEEELEDGGGPRPARHVRRNAGEVLIAKVAEDLSAGGVRKQ